MSDPIGVLMDDLNAALRRCAEAFEVIAPGVAAEIPLTDEATLHFCKWGRVWGLYVTGKGSKDPLPLCSANRELRLLAVEKLPEMKEALLMAEHHQRKLIIQRTADAHAFADSILGRSE